jgi:hypothetical protein
MSIGYRAIDTERRRDDGARLLKSVRLFECPFEPPFEATKSAPAAPVRGEEQGKGDSVLTPEMLSLAVRSTTKPKVLFKIGGLDVVPYSIWLDLPRNIADSIDRVEYWFNYPSFANPKRSVKKSSIFIANWNGYGCISSARVTAFMKGGGTLVASFDLCEVQRKF